MGCGTRHGSSPTAGGLLRRGEGTDEANASQPGSVSSVAVGAGRIICWGGPSKHLYEAQASGPTDKLNRVNGMSVRGEHGERGLATRCDNLGLYN